MGRKSGGNIDALVVRTDELASVLQLWIDKHNGRFPATDPRSSTANFTSGYDYIISRFPDTLYHRLLWRILNLEAKHTSLGIADEVLTAIDDAGALEDGRIEVIPNPRWNNETWLAWKAEQGCI